MLISGLSCDPLAQKLSDCPTVSARLHGLGYEDIDVRLARTESGLVFYIDETAEQTPIMGRAPLSVEQARRVALLIDDALRRRLERLASSAPASSAAASSPSSQPASEPALVPMFSGFFAPAGAAIYAGELLLAPVASLGLIGKEPFYGRIAIAAGITAKGAFGGTFNAAAGTVFRLPALVFVGLFGAVDARVTGSGLSVGLDAGIAYGYFQLWAQVGYRGALEGAGPLFASLSIGPFFTF